MGILSLSRPPYRCLFKSTFKHKLLHPRPALSLSSALWADWEVLNDFCYDSDAILLACWACMLS